MSQSAAKQAKEIFDASIAVIRISGVGGICWKRNVAKEPRIGPWLQGIYEILNEEERTKEGPCLYLVRGSDGNIRYVGISGNGLKRRWRLAPAYDAETGVRFPTKQLFHSQCWKHIERECQSTPEITFEVRSITADTLVPILRRLGPPLSDFSNDNASGEVLVARVEEWMCRQSTDEFVAWNVAMTNRQYQIPYE